VTLERRQAVWATTIVAAVTLVAYVRTAYPGLVMIGDSPKFQFVGSIWGTPHQPGYPLYVVLSHVFGLLPIGSLAFRVNVMSAVFGAVTAGLVTLIVLRLWRNALAAAGAGLFLAFGQVFWSQATIAEVYTLAAALQAAALLCLCRWLDTRRDRDVWLAALCVALALGNHLTIVVMAPSLALLVVTANRRDWLKPGLIAGVLAILCAGLAQYGLILYWTTREPAYMEAAARNVTELWDVMRGSQFESRLFTVRAADVITERVPALLAILLSEARWWGVPVAAGGLVACWRRRPALAVSLALGWLSIVAFVANYDVADPQVFLIPAFVVTAVACGGGLSWLVARLSRSASAWRTALTVAVALAPATALFASNFRRSDHSGRSYEDQLMTAVFRAIPDQALVVPGTFAEQLMLSYKLLGERLRDTRGIEAMPVNGAAAGILAAWRAGRRVYALGEARDALVRSGAVFEPVPLWDPSRTALVPFEGSSLLFRLVDVTECRDVGNSGWTDVSMLAGSGEISGRLDNYRPFVSTIDFVVAADRELTPALSEWTGPGTPAVEVAPWSPGGEPSVAPQPPPAGRYRYVVRIEVNDEGQFGLFRVTFGGAPAAALVKVSVDLNNPKRATLCSGRSMF
jgi:hypothetical protein